MKRIVLFSGLVLFPLTLLLLLQPAHGATPSVTAAARHDVSAPLRDMAFGKGNPQGSSQEMPEPRPTRVPFSSGTSDPVAQQLGGVLPGVTTGLNFEGPRCAGHSEYIWFRLCPAGYERRGWRDPVCADRKYNDRGV
jgi:hypothetical protein